MTAPPDHEISFVSGGVELLGDVAPLWQRLRDHHVKLNGPFTTEIAAQTFEKRAGGWKTEGNHGEVLVDVAWADDRAIGYCVTTIDLRGEMGEIDSLFVLEEFRRRGIGDRLVRRALQWLDDNEVKDRVVYVICENDPALKFYARFGFVARTVVMKQISKARS